MVYLLVILRNIYQDNPKKFCSFAMEQPKNNCGRVLILVKLYALFLYCVCTNMYKRFLLKYMYALHHLKNKIQKLDVFQAPRYIKGA